MNANRTWQLLERRASTRVDEAFQSVLKVRQQLREVDESRQRLVPIVQEYERRLSALEAGPHSVGQSAIYRNYIAQIQALQRKLDDARAHVQRQLASVEAGHRAAEAERARMGFLADAQTRRAEVHQRKLDARAMDALAISRHGLV
jgi:flagellar biosynthesis chaperone FliJ